MLLMAGSRWPADRLGWMLGVCSWLDLQRVDFLEGQRRREVKPERPVVADWIPNLPGDANDSEIEDEQQGGDHEYVFHGFISG